MLLLVGDWATTKHRGFKVEVMDPGEMVTRIIGSTFFTLPDVSCQTNGVFQTQVSQKKKVN